MRLALQVLIRDNYEGALALVLFLMFAFSFLEDGPFVFISAGILGLHSVGMSNMFMKEHMDRQNVLTPPLKI